jgi:hypothetical protein
VAPILSQKRAGADGKKTPSSESKDWSHVSSAAALAIALYSDSVLDQETVGCFLELQEIRFVPRKTQNPEVDFRSSGHPAQLASV